jgi:hypothetical protein
MSSYSKAIAIRSGIYLLCVSIWLSASLSVARGQAVTLVPQEREYFQFLFVNIGNPQDSPKDLERREQEFSGRFGLDPKEQAALRAAAKTFHLGLTAIREMASAIAGSRAPLSESDRTQLSLLLNRRDELAETVSRRLLEQLRPQSAAALRHAASQTKR